MKTKAKEQLLTAKEAAQRLRIDTLKNPRLAIYRMGKRGELETRRVAGRLMVVERSVDRLIGGRA